MKLRNYLTVFFVIASCILISCVSQNTSVIVGADYNEAKNQTVHFVLPYGRVTIPGKWEKTSYNSVSHQQFFINGDSIKIAIAFNSINGYEFNTDGAKKKMDFVKAFYDWDSGYFLEKYGLESDLIETDSLKNFVIYRIYGNYDNIENDTYYLIGEKNGNVSNFSVQYTKKWEPSIKVGFLKNLFIAEEATINQEQQQK